MKLSQDFRDLLAALEESKAEYLLIGGYAVAAHGRPRATKDIDIWIGTTPENIQRVIAALIDFGAPPRAIQDLQTWSQGEIVWFGSPPGRVDILGHIPGVSFAESYGNRTVLRLNEIEVSLISKDDLISAKRAAGRPQDLVDADALEALEE